MQVFFSFPIFCHLINRSSFFNSESFFMRNVLYFTVGICQKVSHKNAIILFSTLMSLFDYVSKTGFFHVWNGS